MDVAKRNQFIARLSRALGRDQEMCPAFVEGSRNYVPRFESRSNFDNV